MGRKEITALYAVVLTRTTLCQRSAVLSTTLCLSVRPSVPNRSSSETDGRIELFLGHNGFLRTRSIPDMELGHWVTGSMGHLDHLSHPGHRVLILTRCETRVFPVSKSARNATKRTFEMLK